MFPVLDLANLRVALVRIQSKEIVLYGFLLYTDVDEVMVKYVKLGFDEVDRMAEPECVVFVVEAPSSEWIERTRRKKSWWLDIVAGQKPGGPAPSKGPSGVPVAGTEGRPSGKREPLSRLLTVLARNPELFVFDLPSGEVADARHLLDPQYQLPYNRSEGLEVARFFGAKLHDVPCLIFFETLDASPVWMLKLGELQTVEQVGAYLRETFDCEDFQRILLHARTYARTA